MLPFLLKYQDDVTLKLLLIWLLFLANFAQAKDIEIRDVVNDDKGGGYVLFPIGRDFYEGDLDLSKIQVISEKNSKKIKLTFKNKIRNSQQVNDSRDSVLKTRMPPFYQFNVDIYFKLKSDPIFSVATMPGRNVSMTPGWSKAIILSPMPNEEQEVANDFFNALLSESELMGASSNQTSEDIKEKIWIPSNKSIKVRNKTLTVEVPEAFIESEEEIESLLVIVTGFEPDSSLFGADGKSLIKPINPKDSQDGSFNIKAGYYSYGNVIDVLYPDARTQKKFLSSKEKNAVFAPLPMLDVNGDILTLDKGLISQAVPIPVEQSAKRKIDEAGIEQRFEKLKSLFDAGLITEEEYKDKKRELLKLL